MNYDFDKLTVLIPSLEPDIQLVIYVRDLLQNGIRSIVVVNDGSDESYAPIFSDLEKVGCIVLTHDVNRGKGCALKTGYQYILDQMPWIMGIITADADGQHKRYDVCELGKQLLMGKEGLLLGSRDFTLPNVPIKSRLGNKITSVVFWLLYGSMLPDTQTGLRAFARKYLPFMIDVEGSRFEYEMNVLIACARSNVPMSVAFIETVYLNENKGSHFHPLKDSFRIYKVLLNKFFLFMYSSVISTVVDMLLCFILMDMLRTPFTYRPEWIWIGISTLCARLVSANVNFILNKKVVFRLKTHGGNTFVKYIILCAIIASLSWGGVSFLHMVLEVNEKASKVILDILLFFVSYRVQQRWVFNELEKKG